MADWRAYNFQAQSINGHAFPTSFVLDNDWGQGQYPSGSVMVLMGGSTRPGIEPADVTALQCTNQHAAPAFVGVGYQGPGVVGTTGEYPGNIGSVESTDIFGNVSQEYLYAGPARGAGVNAAILGIALSNGEGTGVIGQGASGVWSAPTNPTDTQPSYIADPGTGVIGNGGVQGDYNQGRPPGAGVVGVAGGGQNPSFIESGGVGVFGQGGDAIHTWKTVPSPPDSNQLPFPFLFGPSDPGIGVLGRGGSQDTIGPGPHRIPKIRHEPGGPGVVGIAGNVGTEVTALPSMNDFANTGVFGKSRVGRGGVFQSDTRAQVCLVPGEGPKPPAIGQAGDLYVTVTGGSAQMYLCVISGDGTPPAQWAEFQLGLPFPGG
jgi:hypothetical protein